MMQTQSPASGAASAQAPTLQSPTPPTPPAVAPPALPTSQGDALQSLLGQLASLQAQRDFLSGQLRRTPPAGRPALTAQIASYDAQIAGIRAQIVSLEMAMRQRPGGRPYTPPPYYLRNPGMSDNQLALAIVFVLAVLMPLSIGLTRLMLRRTKPTAQPSQDPVPSPRLERLEQAVDAIAIEVERVSEGQRFITKILAERPATSAGGPGQSAGTAAPGDPPYRALGAGPIEPIVAAEKQRVRQSITPH